MTEHKRNIDEFFQEELGNNTEAPPSLVWETLENRLDNKSERPFKMWWVYSLLLIILFGGSIAAYRYVANDNDSPAVQNTAQNDMNSLAVHNADVISNEEIEDKNVIGNLNNSAEGSEFDQQKNTIQNTTSVTNNNSQASNISGTSKASSIADNNVNDDLNARKGNGLKSKTQNAEISGNLTSGNTSFLKKEGSLSADKSSLRSSINNGTGRNLQHSSKLPLENGNVSANGSGTEKKQNLAAKTKTASKKNIKGVAAAKKSSNGTSGNYSYDESNSSSKNDSNNVDHIASVNKFRNKKSKVISEQQISTAAKANKGSTSTDQRKRSSVASNNKKVSRSPRKKKLNELVSSDRKAVANNAKKIAEKSDQSAQADISKAENKETKTSATDKSVATTVNAKPSEPSAAKPALNTANDKSASKKGDSEKTIVQSESKDNKTSLNGVGEPGSSGKGDDSAAKKTKVKRPLNFYIGAKAGYERGFDPYIAHKIIGNIFGEVKFSNRLSFLLQPGIRIANTNKDYVKSSGSFYRADSTNTTLVSVLTDTFGRPYQWNYRISQNYDSMIASSSAGRRFVEMELPLLFRYKLDKNFSVLAGMSFSFGKVLGFNTTVKTLSGLSLIDSAIVTIDSTTKPPLSAQFLHTGSTPFSSYTASATDATSSPMRFGYMLGFSYAFREKLMIDFMLQQNLSGTKNISDAEIRRLFTQPYVRLTLGYIIFGAGKK